VEQVTALQRSVDSLADDVVALRQSFDRRTWVIIAAALTLLISVVAAIFVGTRVQADNDRRIKENNLRWCPMVMLLVPLPTDPPAPTERGRRIAATATSLATAFGCDSLKEATP
jgi:hypothetical protein